MAHNQPAEGGPLAAIVAFVRDALGEARSEELLQHLQIAVEQVKTLGLNEIRPWKEMFTHLKPPRQWDREEVEKRVVTNFLHYRTNYLCLYAGFMIFMLLTSPLLLFTLIATLAIWVYLLVVRKAPLVIMEQHLDTQKKAMLAAGSTLMLLLLSGQLFKLLGINAFVLLLVAAHMLFRQRNIKSKFNRIAEEMKLNGLFYTGSGDAGPNGSADDLEDGGAEQASFGVSSSVNTPSLASVRHRGTR